MATIYQNSTITLNANFIGQSTGIPSDPQSVQIQVLDSTNTVVLTDTPQRQGVGSYSYVWSPPSTGSYTFEFVGTWLLGPPTITQTQFSVVPNLIEYSSTQTLVQDQEINFLVNPSPFILDPEEFQGTFPDASLFQIAQFIAQFSMEAQNILKVQTTDTLYSMMATDPLIAQTVLDFVQAATNCALSRVYDITNGANTSLVTLGDLTVQTENPVSTVAGRANATTWCELAAVVRDELYRMSMRSGMKAIVKGTAFRNPIPRRRIRHVEWRDWSPYSGDGSGVNEGYDELPWKS